MCLNSKDIEVLKYIKKHDKITSDDLLKLFHKRGENIRFNELMHGEYIDENGKRDSNGSFIGAGTYCLTDLGYKAITDYEAENTSRLAWLVKDKALNIVVAMITAFLTSVLTYFIMPQVVAFFTS